MIAFILSPDNTWIIVYNSRTIFEKDMLLESSFTLLIGDRAVSFNWLDIVILIVFIYYAWEGYILGFFIASLDLVSFLVSFFIGIRFYSIGGKWLSESFSVPHGFSNAIAFFTIAFLSELLLSILLRRFLGVFLLIRKGRHSQVRELFGMINRLTGVIPGVFSAAVLLTFLLTVVVIFPLPPVLKNSIFESSIGSVLVSRAQGFEKRINPVFEGAIKETLSFLTVEPKSDEFVDLHFTAFNRAVDEEAEERMLVLVNKEREAKGLVVLVMDEKLRLLARAYADDMLSRGYFSHYSPEGISPFDRMRQAGISYQAAGENLALAPNVDLAMEGLMQSPGHRANILSRDFRKVGIGVIDGGIYGQMFTQEFTD